MNKFENVNNKLDFNGPTSDDTNYDSCQIKYDEIN